MLKHRRHFRFILFASLSFLMQSITKLDPQLIKLSHSRLAVSLQPRIVVTLLQHTSRSPSCRCIRSSGSHSSVNRDDPPHSPGPPPSPPRNILKNEGGDNEDPASNAWSKYPTWLRVSLSWTVFLGPSRLIPCFQELVLPKPGQCPHRLTTSNRLYRH